MKLHPQAIEPYQLLIQSNAPVQGLDASFDGGLTWVAGESVEPTVEPSVTLPHVTEWRWTIAGPSATSPPAGAITIPGDVRPLLRATSGTFKLIRPSDAAINVT